MEKKRIAVICHFSNSDIQKCLSRKISILELIYRKFTGKPVNIGTIGNDFAVWNTNAFLEYEKYLDSIDFHIIAPYDYLKPCIQSFDIHGIHYHFFKNEDSIFINRIKHKVFRKTNFSLYKKNRELIKRIIKDVCPDIVYCVGAENPYYSLSVLDIPASIPTVTHLQTLLNDPQFEKNYPILHDNYLYKARIEKEIIQRSDFIGTGISKYINIIKTLIKPNAITLDMKLAIGEKLDIQYREKKDFDFVYFSANINKAFDLALEAFALAHEKENSCNLLVVGDYSPEYKGLIDKRINELGLNNYISFTGRLPTHNDVLNEIQRARFALLPLKIDITSGTIREAFSCKLPVVTTITDGGTPYLNKKRETVLLSEIGNHPALACNMLKLLHDKQLTEKLIKNGLILMQEEYDNVSIVERQISCLIAAYENFSLKKALPEKLIPRNK